MMNDEWREMLIAEDSVCESEFGMLTLTAVRQSQSRKVITGLRVHQVGIIREICGSLVSPPFRAELSEMHVSGL